MNLRHRIASAAVGIGFGFRDLFGPSQAQPFTDDQSIEHRDEVTQHGYILELTPSYETITDELTGEEHDIATGEGSKLEMFETKDVAKEKKRLIAEGKKFMVAMTMEEAANMHTKISFGFASPEQDQKTRNPETLATPEKLAALFSFRAPSPEYAAKFAKINNEEIAS